MAHAFLSDGWFDAAEAIYDEISPPVPAAIADLVINFRIKDAPDGDVEARMQAGRLVKGFGDGAPTTVNIPYEIAQKMMVEQDPNAGMQAFMSGQIQVEGDMAAMMSMQAAGPPSPEAEQVATRVREMTT